MRVARVLVTTVPFAEHDPRPIELLEAVGAEYLVNPIGRKLTEGELAEMITDTEVVIAGTEPITAHVMDAAPRLRLISRVGVGLDSVDLAHARTRGIAVSYTPEAPAPAVAELTIGLALSLLRETHVANAQMHRGIWERHMGRRASDITFGIVGVGRIGGRVIQHLRGIGATRILAHDLHQDADLAQRLGFTWAAMPEILVDSDLISLHVPLTERTRGMFGDEHLRAMRAGSWLINTARGGIVDETALHEALVSRHLRGAAIDVFENEPYQGPLSALESCLLTSHMGSMSFDCRTVMEIEATAEAVRYLRGERLASPVPDSEYPI